MGITLLTALTIQSNDVEIHTFSRNEKYGYEIARFGRGNYRPLLTCEPIYKTESEARVEGTKLIKEIKEMDLSDKIRRLKQNLGEDESKIVEDIASATQ